MKKGWKASTLGNVLDIQNGYAFDSKKFADDGDMPLIRIRDLKNGTTTATRYSGEYEAKYVVRAGDLLIGMDGEFACHEWKGGPALLNQRVCRLKDFSSSLLPRFLFYGINKFLKDIEDVTTFTTVKHLSARQIKAIEFPLPPLSEQKRIVAILDEAFAGIATAVSNTEKNLANTRELFESYLKSVFSQQGKAWQRRKLSEVCVNLDSRRVPITKSKRKPGQIPYYGASGVVDHVADYIFDEDLLLVSEDGANLLARTYPIAFSISGKSWVNNHAHVLRFAATESQRFIEYYLNSISLEPYVSGMAQPKLNQKALNSIKVPFPPVDQQRLSVDKLDEIAGGKNQLSEIYRQKLISLTELRQSLLQKAFSGELTTAPQDEIETALA